MDVQLMQDLVKVSNNSHTTQTVHNIINKLSDSDKREFKLWLRLVKQQTELKVAHAVKRF